MPGWRSGIEAVRKLFSLVCNHRMCARCGTRLKHDKWDLRQMNIRRLPAATRSDCGWRDRRERKALENVVLVC